MNDNKVYKWQDFYKLPFINEEYSGSVIALPHPGGYGIYMMWDWIDNDWVDSFPSDGRKGEQLADAIVRWVNGESEYRPDYTWSISPDDCTVVQMNGQDCLDIRGLGNISSTIGDDKVAAKIQDEFIKWLVDKLNGKE